MWKFPTIIPLQRAPNTRNTFEDIAIENIYVGNNDYYTFLYGEHAGEGVIIKHTDQLYVYYSNSQLSR